MVHETEIVRDKVERFVLRRNEDRATATKLREYLGLLCSEISVDLVVSEICEAPNERPNAETTAGSARRVLFWRVDLADAHLMSVEVRSQANGVAYAEITSATGDTAAFVNRGQGWVLPTDYGGKNQNALRDAILVFLASVLEERSQPECRESQWEYLARAIGPSEREMEAILNSFGRQGWDLVQAVPNAPDRTVAIFKRKVAKLEVHTK